MIFSFSLPKFTALSRLIGLALVLLALRGPATAQAQTWMVSTNAYIKLGVLDKYGQLGPYKATFIVHNEKTGKEYLLVKQLEKGQQGVDVLFPTEPTDLDYFKTAAGESAKATPGRYTWECQVAGKRAVSGHFIFPEVGNDITVIDQR